MEILFIHPLHLRDERRLSAFVDVDLCGRLVINKIAAASHPLLLFKPNRWQETKTFQLRKRVMMSFAVEEDP